MKAKLNTRHLVFLIMGVTIVSLKTYPTVLINLSQRETWVVMIAACAIVFAFIYYILKCFDKISEYRIDKVFKMAFGKVFGNIALFIYMLCILATLFESPAVEANVMHVGFLLHTPVTSFLIFSVIAATIVMKKGGAAIVTTSVIALVLISTSGILLGILTVKYKEGENLLPIFANGIRPEFFLSLIKAIGGLSCFSIVIPYFEGVENKVRIKRWCLGGFLIVAQMQIVSITGVLSTFTLERAKMLIYPKIIQTQLVSYFGFMEAGELFVMHQVVAGWFMKFCITFYALLLVLEKMNIKFNYLSVVVGIITLCVSLPIAKDTLLLFDLLSRLLDFQFIAFFVLPLVAATIALVKYTIKEKKSEISIGKATANDR